MIVDLATGTLAEDERRGKPQMIGGNWKGDSPRFRNLRWETRAQE